MPKITECPKCKSKFSTKRHLKYRLQTNLSFFKLAIDNAAFPWKRGLEEVYKANLLICPECGYEFSTHGYKYFGILTVKQFQIGLAILVLSFLFAPVFFICWYIWNILDSKL
jgi:hypothetical protein